MKRTLLFASLIGACAIATPSYADDDDSFLGWALTLKRMKEFKPVDNDSYAEECGSCHLAYPPGLLPTASWEKLLAPAALEDHFGENAELDEEVLKPIQDYVLSNAAEKSHYKRSRKIARAAERGEAPLRITELSYIKRKHHEITDKMIVDNPDVQSLSNCNACHTKAEQAIFDDDTVNIPNYPDWED